MRHRQSEKWHHDLKKAVEGFTPLNSTRLGAGQVVMLYYPLEKLQVHTNYYLEKKGSLNSHQRDNCLVALVEDHPNRDVAIVACAHALSKPAVLRLLQDFPIEPTKGWGAILCLRAITGVHHAKWEVVDEVEAQLAQSLILLSTSYDPDVGRYVYAFFANWSRIEPSHLFLRPFVNQILVEAGTSFTNRLEIILREGQLRHAYEESHWLSIFLNVNPGTQQLLDTVIPTWRIWALWRPDINRLDLWEGLPDQQRRQLVDVLALEGPDFATCWRSTLFEGVLPADADEPCSRVFVNELEMTVENGNGALARIMLHRLLKIFDTACSKSESSLILFSYICMSKPVDAESLRFLELINSIGIPSIDTAVLSALTAKENSDRAAAAIQLLPFLNGEGYQDLRKIFTPLIIEPVEDEIFRMQDTLCNKLQKGRAVHDMAMELFVYGETLKKATWLQPKFNERIQTFLQSLPEEKDLETLLKLRTDIRKASLKPDSRLLGTIDAYCREILAGREANPEEVKAAVASLVHFWQQPSDSTCHIVAIAMAERTTISPELRSQCLAQLNKMKKDLVYDISLMVAKDTDMNCVNFARLLASEHLLNTEGIECWCKLLLDLIEQRNDTLLEHTLTNLSVESWLQWMNDLRTIFRGHNIPDPPSAVLKHALHPWTVSLSTKYVDVLKTLEVEVGTIGALRWILLGSDQSRTISPILEQLRQPQGQTDPAIRALMQQLAPDGSNSSMISDLIFQLSHTTPAGKQAYLRMLEVHQNSTQDMAESTLALWLQSADLTVRDISALKSMATILGLRVPSSNSELPTSLQKCADRIDSEYAALMEEANRLEGIRLSLKAENQVKTSTLLAKIGIEDPSALEDSYAGVPTGLLDVVERIDEGEYEMSFPLTHLKPMNRIAAGVGDAQLLLVRVMVTDSAQLQKFCIHLHPEPLSTGSNTGSRAHSYHDATSHEAPDMHICHGKANRITYQLCRALWQFKSRGMGNLGTASTLESIHNAVSRFIENIAQNCIVCGLSLGSRSWRSTTCRKDCSIAFRKSSLEVRLQDLRLDPQVVDLLLTSVHAAAIGNSNLLSQLLTGCPAFNTATLRQVLSFIPATTTMQNAPDLASSLTALGSQVEALLSWLCTSYRGFLATTTEALRIPSMPGVRQFVLLNGAPELEKRFAAHMQGPSSSQVVFHGTSFDRLYAILRDGLKVNSGGQLQRHGAAMGRGIYLADEPNTALAFANQTASDARSGGWTASPFLTFRVLLGCEVAGQSVGANGVHVITDPSKIMVRYIFLFPANVRGPLAIHVVPALTSAYATLRLGTG